MASTLQVEIPAAHTVLAHTVESLPHARCELEKTAAIYADNSWPCTWIAGHPRVDIGTALYNDPTVSGFEFLKEYGTAALYRIDVAETATAFQDALAAADGIVVEGTCTDGRWNFTVRFRTRALLSQAHQDLQERGLSPTVRAVVNTAEEPAGQRGLTTPQREALAYAVQHGYFEIPRQISLEELAAKLGITHQALSERLRRAYEALAAAELDVATDSRGIAEMDF